MRSTARITTMVVAMICAVTLLDGCTVATRSPKAAFNKVGNAEQSGYEIESAFNTAIVKWPGLTWSISGTYLPAGESTTGKSKNVFAYTYAGSYGFKLNVSGPVQCAPSSGAEDQTTEALDSLFARIGGWPAHGAAAVKLANTGASVQRYAMSARWGKNYHLDYIAPCFAPGTDDAFWFAAMVGLHESTHAALSLSGHQPCDVDQRENIAVGAESCLLLALSKGSDEFLRRHTRLTERITERYQANGENDSMGSLCAGWNRYMEKALGQEDRVLPPSP